jgi:hypothetical protein
LGLLERRLDEEGLPIPVRDRLSRRFTDAPNAVNLARAAVAKTRKNVIIFQRQVELSAFSFEFLSAAFKVSRASLRSSRDCFADNGR